MMNPRITMKQDDVELPDDGSGWRRFKPGVSEVIVGVDMASAMAATTVRVKVIGLRRAGLRIRAGILVLRAAVAIIGSQIDIELTGSTDEA